MTILTTSQARARLFGLVEKAAQAHEPVRIKGRRRSAVLVSEEDWQAIQETLYLLAVPGMRESIRKGMRAPLAACRRVPGW